MGHEMQMGRGHRWHQGLQGKQQGLQASFGGRGLNRLIGMEW